MTAEIDRIRQPAEGLDTGTIRAILKGWQGGEYTDKDGCILYTDDGFCPGCGNDGSHHPGCLAAKEADRSYEAHKAKEGAEQAGVPALLAEVGRLRALVVDTERERDELQAEMEQMRDGAAHMAALAQDEIDRLRVLLGLPADALAALLADTRKP